MTGRLNYGGAALKQAASGALPGELIGWMFGSFNLISHWWPALSSRSTGWSSGAVLGLAIHALQRGRRDFDAVRMTVPSRCEVVAMTRLPTRQGVCSPTLRYRPRLAVSVRGERPAQQP
ncbi:MAG: hypothetical protein QOJ06_128, partial [Pseudonocardiales bacterium]|nr:hypothetical protein [Pseudonocardiales bacterium]